MGGGFYVYCNLRGDWCPAMHDERVRGKYDRGELSVVCWLTVCLRVWKRLMHPMAESILYSIPLVVCLVIALSAARQRLCVILPRTLIRKCHAWFHEQMLQQQQDVKRSAKQATHPRLLPISLAGSSALRQKLHKIHHARSAVLKSACPTVSNSQLVYPSYYIHLQHKHCYSSIAVQNPGTTSHTTIKPINHVGKK